MSKFDPSKMAGAVPMPGLVKKGDEKASKKMRILPSYKNLIACLKNNMKKLLR
ncbi:MAG: hypothetical protein KA998_02760 [Rickettsiaceae bacterium]|nr:hypothetical protein [Rickettsiaceae bacterium]